MPRGHSHRVEGFPRRRCGRCVFPMVKLDSRRSCWTSPNGHHNRYSLMAGVANQAVVSDKSMLTACRHLRQVTAPKKPLGVPTRLVNDKGRYRQRPEQSSVPCFFKPHRACPI